VAGKGQRLPEPTGRITEAPEPIPVHIRFRVLQALDSFTEADGHVLRWSGGAVFVRYPGDKAGTWIQHWVWAHEVERM
jgi:hypothetical protein